jgi:hypothetical protein
MYSISPDRRLEANNALKLLERFASPDAFVAVSFLERLRDNAHRPRSTWLAEIEGWDHQRQHDTQWRLRPREESIEEQALRRRRREAVVVNEGDHPLTQQDIIQRSPSHATAGATREIENRRLLVERALEALSHMDMDERVDEHEEAVELARRSHEEQPDS